MMKKIWIAMLGADGAGKSTVIDGVTEQLENEGLEIEYQHWKPSKYSDLKPGGASAVEDPHNQKPRGVLMSRLKAVCLVGIWRWRFFRNIGDSMKQGKLVLFDRFYGDMLVDSKRYRYHGGRSFAKYVFRFMPKPNAVIYLDADTEVLLSRKQEVEERALENIVRGYRVYANETSYAHTVDASQPAEKVISDVLTIIKSIYNK